MRRAELLATVHAVESQFSHPVARALAAATSGEAAFSELVVLPGQGVAAQTELGNVRIGERDLLPQVSTAALDVRVKAPEGKRVYVFLDQQPVAVVVLCGRQRAGKCRRCGQLAELKIEAEVLTGDPQPAFDLPPAVRLRSGLSAADKGALCSHPVKPMSPPCYHWDQRLATMAVAAASLAMGSGAALARSATSGQLTADRLQALFEPRTLAGDHRHACAATRLRGPRKSSR